ncbi:unnamed protein product [Prorocentrum cordatum]|uniref:SET domain-containing protein n=1 Tax=Prorocentrum cordatum TaxID=2364126 RepID=A0ABN9SBL4_9DINO|nr:unnamed protein product [Polarella glacialis]
MVESDTQERQGEMKEELAQVHNALRKRRTWWSSEERFKEPGKRPREGGLAAEQTGPEEHRQEHDEMIAEKMPPPLGMDLKAPRQRNRHGGCRNPVNMEDPEQLSKRLEGQNARAAEKRDGEEYLDKHSDVYKCRNDAGARGNKLDDIRVKRRQSQAALVDGRGAIASKHDCTNALASTKRNRRLASVFAALKEDDSLFAVEALACASMSMARADDWLRACKGRARGANGIRLAPKAWRQGGKGGGEMQTLHDTMGQVHEEERDLSLNAFMDNITKIHAVASSVPLPQESGVSEHQLGLAQVETGPQGSCKGTPVKDMRALGPRRPRDQGCAGEIKRRCEAMQWACRQYGRFWSSRISDAITKEMFKAFVPGAGLSELATLVLGERRLKALDSTMSHTADDYEEFDLRACINGLQGLALCSAAEMRDVICMASDSILMSDSNWAPRKSMAAGQNYGNQVGERGGGRKMGPPGIHAGTVPMAAITETIKMRKVSESNKTRNIKNRSPNEDEREIWEEGPGRIQVGINEFPSARAARLRLIVRANAFRSAVDPLGALAWHALAPAEQDALATADPGKVPCTRLSLFLRASLINHSEAPNAAWLVAGGVIAVRATESGRRAHTEFGSTGAVTRHADGEMAFVPAAVAAACAPAAARLCQPRPYVCGRRWCRAFPLRRVDKRLAAQAPWALAGRWLGWARDWQRL